MAALNSKQVEEALAHRDGIIVHIDDEQMTLTLADLTSKRKAATRKAFQDKFSGQSYYLWYYKWTPDKPTQEPLFETPKVKEPKVVKPEDLEF